MPTVELVYDADCPNIAEARARLLRAFAEAKVEPRWQEWRGDDPASPPHARGLGSPTILVGGRDVGETGLESACCRLYPAADGSLQGAPDVAAIAAALRTAAPPAPTPPALGGRWKLNLAVLPGIGAAFLPKVACPACWPAYAGFLGSVGLGFLLDTTYLLPLTAVFLVIAVGALGYRARRRHGYRPLLVGLVAAAVVLIGKFAFESDPAMYAGLVLLVGASVWNTWPRRRQEPTCPSCIGGEQATNP